MPAENPRRATLKMTHTRAALIVYDAGEAQRDAMLAAAMTNEEVHAWVVACDAAKELVADAFYQDTKDRNPRDRCSLVSISELHKWIAKFDPE